MAIWTPGPWDDDHFARGESPHGDAIAKPAVEEAPKPKRRARKPKPEAA